MRRLLYNLSWKLWDLIMKIPHLKKYFDDQLAAAVDRGRRLAVISNLNHTANLVDLQWPPHPTGRLYEAVKRVYQGDYSEIAARYPFPISPVEDQDGTFMGFVYNPQADLSSMRWMLSVDWLIRAKEMVDQRQQLENKNDNRS